VVFMPGGGGRSDVFPTTSIGIIAPLALQVPSFDLPV
jgi:hypothetical protein